jgi:hypothetical protein
MNAHATQAELELYVVGALEGPAAEALEAHCASCPACAGGLAREARLEIAFEQVARRAARAPSRRPARAAAYGAAGVLAMAAAAMLWLGRTTMAPGDGSAATAAGQVMTQDGAILDARNDVLDGG